MTKVKKIEGTEEEWDTGALGRDENFVSVAKDMSIELLDDSLELQMISIRLQKSLIEDFKMIAELHGIGYQPLIRQTLMRFADCEKKQLLREAAAEKRKEQGIASGAEDYDDKQVACS